MESVSAGEKSPEPMTKGAGEVGGVAAIAVRRRLPDERQGITHKFCVGGQKGYVTVGLYPDGVPGEIFIAMSKEGSTVSGLMDAFATSVSLALQYGVPLKVLCDKFSHMRFEPSGWSGNPEIGYAKSLMDYLFRWLELRFLKAQQQKLFESAAPSSKELAQESVGKEAVGTNGNSSVPPPSPDTIYSGDAPFCVHCGSIMSKAGSCWRCENCGGTSGCS